MRSIERWHLQWPWRTPNPVFKVTAFLKSNISKRCIIWTMLLKNTNRKTHDLPNRATFNDLEWPLTSISRSWHFSTLNISETTRQSHSYYRTSIGSHMRSVVWWHFQWPWWTPKPVFMVPAVLKLNLKRRCEWTCGCAGKTVKSLRTRAIPERFWGGDSLRRGAISSVCTFTNRKPYTIFRMVPLSMTLSDLWRWPRFQGHDISWSRIS